MLLWGPILCWGATRAILIHRRTLLQRPLYLSSLQRTIQPINHPYNIILWKIIQAKFSKNISLSWTVVIIVTIVTSPDAGAEWPGATGEELPVSFVSLVRYTVMRSWGLNDGGGEEGDDGKCVLFNAPLICLICTFNINKFTKETLDWNDKLKFITLLQHWDVGRC